ncbi:MAG: c-type cytochrome [Gemmatimonadetes bacterium]|nr:c-type cytochrome [Gemmatimonadota bacterium]
MWATNLKILALVIGTLGAYTLVASIIPQVQSDVPTELTFGSEVSAAELVAAGEQIYAGAGGCTTCHGLGTRAPNLLTDEGGQGTIGTRCGNRVSGEDCKAYLHRSLVEPMAHVVEGYQPIMQDMSRTLSPAQIWSVVAYLQSLGGEVTVSGEDVAAAQQASGSGAAGAAPGAAAATTTAMSTTTDPVEIMQQSQCLLCHVLRGQGGPIGPSFDGMGARLTADYIRRSILQPNADTASGFAAMAGTMPQTFGQQLSAAQLEALVQFLSQQR